MKKDIASFVSFGIFFAFVLLLAGIVNNYDGHFSGNVVWNWVDYGNCSDDSIKALWNNIFLYKASSYNLNIEKRNQMNGYCDEFFVYNYTVDGGLDVIYAKLWNNSWNETEIYNLDDNNRINFSVDYQVLHVNVSEEFVNYFKTLDIDDKILELSSLPFENPENITNWSIQTSNNLNSNLSLYFNSDKYSDVFWEEVLENFTFSNETLISGTSYSDNQYFAMKNETFVYFNHYSEYFDPTFYVNILGNVSDFEFEPTTNWTFLFNYSDYVNFSDENSLIVDFSVDSNNSNGKWINASIGEFGNISFKSVKDFTGIRNFSLKIISPSDVNTSMNVFSVLVNTEPEQIEDIKDIYVIDVASVSIDLDDYFEDADGHDLVYGVYSEPNDVNLSINGNTLTVRLLENFSSYDTFRLNITDGFSVIVTDKIYVYDNNDSDDYVAPESGENENNGANNNDSANNDSDNQNPSTTSGNVEHITGTDDSKKVLKITLFSLFGIIGIAIIVIVISLIMKSNKNKKIIRKSYNRPAITQPNHSVTRNQSPPLQQRMGNIPRKNFNNRNSRAYNPQFRK